MAVIAIAAASANAGVIVAEDFIGSGGLLNATVADTFDAVIVAAGGSATWAANSGFKNNGNVNATGKSAYLNLGSYINDAKGTATGKFDLTMTISETTGNWLSLGFAKSNTPGKDNNFTRVDSMGTIIYRSRGELDMWGGLGTKAGTVDGPSGISGTRTLTVSLDVTSATEPGTVTWSDSVLGQIGTTSLPDASIGSIFISAATDSGGTISDLTLTQVPEPATMGLLAIGGLALLRRRRNG